MNLTCRSLMLIGLGIWTGACPENTEGEGEVEGEGEGEGEGESSSPCGGDSCSPQLCSPFTNTCVPARCDTGACGAGYLCDEVTATCIYGPSCQGDEECGEGVCWKFGSEGDACGSVCSVAVARGNPCVIVDDGPTCANFSASCAEGLECTAQVSAIARIADCGDPQPRGEPCHSPEPAFDGCAAGLICELTQIVEAFVGTCQTPAGPGERCSMVNEVGDPVYARACQDGLTCVIDVDAGVPTEFHCR